MGRRYEPPSIKTKGFATYIYTLDDPTNQSLRVYVGWAKDPAARLRGHIGDAEKRCRSINNKWVKSLLARGVTPRLTVVESIADGSDYQEAERFWIASLRAMGMALTNQTDGGHGGHGFKPSRESVERRAAKLRGRKYTPEHCAKVSAALKGRPRSAEAIRKAAEARIGIVFSDEHQRNLTHARRSATIGKRNTTGYKGVRFHPAADGPGTFSVELYGAYLGGKWLGFFRIVEHAAIAYDRAAREAWGADSALNFPFPGERSARPGIEPQEWLLPDPVRHRRVRTCRPRHKSKQTSLL